MVQIKLSITKQIKLCKCKVPSGIHKVYHKQSVPRCFTVEVIKAIQENSNITISNINLL